jgi:hypothetical protein
MHGPRGNLREISYEPEEQWMSSDAVEKHQANIARLIADLRTAKVELLSAQCAADRLRLRYAPQDIVSFGERQTLERAIASVHALSRYFSQVETQLRQEKEGNG